jgi:mutator protein MutT
MSNKRFNLRVYGLIVNLQNEVLICDEVHRNIPMTKFPGGGMEWGESPIECLHRELKEELAVDLMNADLFYLTDFFQTSYRNENDQVVAMYYTCDLLGSPTQVEPNVTFYWVPISDLQEGRLTFPIDRKVCALLRAAYL